MTQRKPWDIVDFLLLAAIAVLLVLVTWQIVEAWPVSPRAGSQVCQQYVFMDGTIPAQIDYLLYLPPDYRKTTKWPLVVYLHGAESAGTT